METDKWKMFCPLGCNYLSGRFKTVHHQEAAGYLSFGGFGLAALFAVGDRRMANGFMEETAKGTQTLEAYFEADIGNSEIL